MSGPTRRGVVGWMLGIAGVSCRRAASAVKVGSSDRRREVIAELVAQHVERRLGVTVERARDLGAGLAAHEALLQGRVDLYAECTGFALTSILKRPHEARPQVVLDRVRLEYENRFRLRWLDPLGFEDGFVIVIGRDLARSWSIATVSGAASREAGWQLAAGGEFLTRPDGMAALMKAYSLRLRGGPVTMPPDAAYRALREGKVTMIAGRAADGELLDEEFVVLEDDQGAFPPNQAALVAREESLARRAGLREALAELSGRIPQPLARRLHAEAMHGRPAAAVAAAFLREL